MPWTDGSIIESGDVAGAFAFFRKGDPESGHVKRRIRRKIGESRGGKGKAYGNPVRTIREEPPEIGRAHV